MAKSEKIEFTGSPGVKLPVNSVMAVSRDGFWSAAIAAGQSVAGPAEPTLRSIGRSGVAPKVQSESPFHAGSPYFEVSLPVFTSYTATAQPAPPGRRPF